MKNTRAPARGDKEDAACIWPEHSIVEIDLQADPDRWGHDPNKYLARCLSTGPFPMLEVLDARGKKHPRFKEPLFEDDYVIWRMVHDECGRVVPHARCVARAAVMDKPLKEIVMRPEEALRTRKKRKRTKKGGGT